MIVFYNERNDEMEDCLKIIAWNVKKIDYNVQPEEFDKLVKEIADQEADIVVLTEVKTAQILCSLLKKSDCNYSFAEISNRNQNGNLNGVNIIVSAKKIKEVRFYDFDRYKQQGKNKVENVKKIIHPDALFATITLNSGKEFSLMGTRFMVSELKQEEKEQQIEVFYDMVKIYRPRIIIGDFNWDSSIKDYIKIKESKKYENKEDKFCGQINKSVEKRIQKANFKMWPVQSDITEKMLCSHVSMRNPNKGTCPDRMIYDVNKIEIVNIDYYPTNLLDKKKNEKEDLWPSDHSMIVLDVKL